MNDTSLISDIAPEAKNLEGYMYPNTVFARLNDDTRKGDQDDGRTVSKGLEAGMERSCETARAHSERDSDYRFADRNRIGCRGRAAHSCVGHLQSAEPGHTLGIDQTVVYVAKMEDRWDGTINVSDINADSPYNTRKYAGLPPGPISSVSESAINAALHPAETNFLY